MKRLAILGSTGSIGQSALSVVAAHPDRLEVVGLAARENSQRLTEQAIRFGARVIALATPEASAEAGRILGGAGRSIAVADSGSSGLSIVATHPDVDIVLCASSGTAALEAILAAIEAGKSIALANKEVLVMAGGLVMAAARRHGVMVLPVDSEHNAIHQCLHGRSRADVRRLILTASGGPFRGRAGRLLDEVSPEDALRHPTWKMGPKITIDSATLMNKGLEVIEAHWLFDVPADAIDVVIHPQSVVHSMVELQDGSVLAQLGVTDMRLPIQYAFSYPDRWEAPLPPLDLTRCAPLEFEAPNHDQFPCLQLAYRALRGSASLPVVLNVANEVAVAAFLEHRIGFTIIPVLIERAMDAHDVGTTGALRDLADVREVDGWARSYSQSLVGRLQLRV